MRERERERVEDKEGQERGPLRTSSFSMDNRSLRHAAYSVPLLTGHNARGHCSINHVNDRH